MKKVLFFAALVVSSFAISSCVSKKDLEACLPKLSYSRTLEDDISNLRVPLRAYLKLHLFKGTPSSDSQERLILMFILCQ